MRNGDEMSGQAQEVEATARKVFSIGPEGGLIPLDESEDAYYEFLRLKADAENLEEERREF
jgi:hypothetical protein